MADKYISRHECEMCQNYLCEKIDSLRREVKILLGTTSLTIILSVIQLVLAR